MKRDFELLKLILIEASKTEENLRAVNGASPHEFSMHAKLLEDVGMVETSSHPVPNVQVMRLTYKGHDAVEVIKSTENVNWSNLVTCDCK